jgi:HEXXH motif-containing protein
MSDTSFHLTLPTDGARSTRALYKRLLKKMARDALGMPAELVGADVSDELLPVVRESMEGQAGALLRAIRRPHVHGLLNCMLRSLLEGDIEEGKRLARAFQFQLVTDLALDGALTSQVTWPGSVPSDVLMSTAHRVYEPLDEVQSIRFGPGLVCLERAEGSTEITSGQGADRFVSVGALQVLALVDNNPISDFEAHPDKEGNQLSCGAAEPDAWATSLEEALSRVGKYLPELRAEMDLLLQQFIPVGTDDLAHLSASYRELIGHVYLTLHPRNMTMTEAVIHEYQHNKINMLFHMDAVMENAFQPLYPSPVRPDPRPLHGVLLAAHAFVPVAELYRRMVEEGDPECELPGFDRRFREIIASNDEAVTVLREHAQPTEAGREVLDELFAIHDRHVALHE